MPLQLCSSPHLLYLFLHLGASESASLWSWRLCLCSYIKCKYWAFKCVRASFCKHLSSGMVFEVLSASAGPALHLLSQDAVVLAAPPLSLHGLYLPPALSRGSRRGGDGARCVGGAWMKNTSNIAEEKERTSKCISGETSGLRNVNMSCSECVFIKPFR